jgi:hypothetical protein
MDSKKPMDLTTCFAAAQQPGCFVCAFLAGDPEYQHETVMRTKTTYGRRDVLHYGRPAHLSASGESWLLNGA